MPAWSRSLVTQAFTFSWTTRPLLKCGSSWKTATSTSPLWASLIFSLMLAMWDSDYEDVVDYTSYYQIAFDKIFSLINENKDSWTSKRTIKITLQRSLFRHLSKNYSILVSAIETMWEKESTNLANTILRIIWYVEINKRNEKDTANNVNAFAMGA